MATIDDFTGWRPIRKTGIAYTPEFLLGRDKPTDFKKLLRLVLIGAGLIWFGLCLHGVYLEMTIGRGY